jgi:MFS family permease
MTLYIFVSLAMFNQIALKGSRMLLSLYAIDLGAGPFAIGILIAMYAVFPLLLALTAGKTADRIGPKWPLIVGSCGLSAGLAIPALFPGLGALYFSPALIGVFWIFFHVSAHQLVGALGDGADRVRNFGTFSLGASVAGVGGPLLVGLILDHLGARASYVILAAIAATPAMVLLLFPRLVPKQHQHHEAPPAGRSVHDLLANPDMRRNLLVSGLVLTGIDLYGFYLPILGRSYGLTSTAIGVIVSMPAVAAFTVRLWMPRLVKRFSEEGVLTGSLALAALAYFAFPLVRDPLVLAPLAFLMGLGLGCGQPLTITLSYNYSPPGRAGEALGLRLTVNKFTQIVVPVAFGSLGAWFGLYPVFWSSAALLAAGSAFNARREKNRPHRPEAADEKAGK